MTTTLQQQEAAWLGEFVELELLVAAAAAVAAVKVAAAATAAAAAVASLIMNFLGNAAETVQMDDPDDEVPCCGEPPHRRHEKTAGADA